MNIPSFRGLVIQFDRTGKDPYQLYNNTATPQEEVTINYGGVRAEKIENDPDFFQKYSEALKYPVVENDKLTPEIKANLKEYAFKYVHLD